MKLEIKDRACIIHQRPYRETSAIIDCLTMNNGRQSFICRGVKKSSRITLCHIQPFQTVEIHWQSKQNHSLHYAKSIEVVTPIWLTGIKLKCGIYLNKLLYRLLCKNETYTDLFNQYEETIQLIDTTSDMEKPLRIFEKNLFAALGYAIPFHQIQSEQCYYNFDVNEGFIQNNEHQHFLGKHIQLIGENKFIHKDVRKTAKSLSRCIINQLYQIHRETL